MLRQICTVTIFLVTLSCSNGAPAMPHPELMYMTDFHEEPMGPVEFIYAPPELEPLTEGRTLPILEDESEEVVPIKMPRMEDEEDDDEVDGDDDKDEDLDDEEDEDEDDDKEKDKDDSKRSDSEIVKAYKDAMKRNEEDEELDELANNEDAFYRSDISLMPVYIESTPESKHKPLADDAEDDDEDNDDEEDADDEDSQEERSDKRGRVLFNHSGINDSYGWYGYPEHKNNWGRHYGHDYNHGDKIVYHHGFYTGYY